MTSLRPAALLAVLALAAASATLAIAAGSGSNPPPRPAPAREATGSDTMPAAPRAALPAQAPDVIAIAFVADWCPACKAMKPKLTAAMREAADSSCLFVNVDQSDRDSRQGEFLLASLGLADLWKENAGKTGFVLLVDPKTHDVVGRLTSDQDTKTMTATIRSFAS